ncbi:hypothetical protein BXO88_12630 [Oribacterium sp. C9]|uniref:sensor histidine kinase n=1 Tax=Oribacterium sp. C9 TaxID=1943579 RepID=UPI00098F0C9C|nr:HAMP domain-containing sensor histidine kinase [Oribacterium sp. C9]OON85355.1 hypothetical protein BXO88_12630 [Oribacterium sp. C9]
MKAFALNNKRGSLYFLIMRGYLGFISGTILLLLCLYFGNYFATQKLDEKYLTNAYYDHYAYEEDFVTEDGRKNTLMIEYRYTDNEDGYPDSSIKYMTILDENGEILYSNSDLSLDKFREYINESQDDSNYVSMFRKYKEIKTRIDTVTAGFLVVGEILLMLFFVFRINKSVLRPLNLLKNAMENFKVKEDKLEPISYTGPKELEEICGSYNDMAEALRKSDEERRRLEEGRQRMLAGISHDLKTPVTVIQGYANAILDGTISPQKELTYVETIFKKSQVLSELINTFHEYSRLEHPDFVLKKTRGDLCEYLREYIANRYDELDIAGFELEVNIPDKSIYAVFDQLELKRVFENLINNTIRHNPKGTTIYVELEKSDSLILSSQYNLYSHRNNINKTAEIQKASPMIRILFGDDGVGISDDVRKNIFDPFVTGDESRKSGNGSGLGLAISKKIIEAHGGFIHLRERSETDHSTEYEILLPVEG